MEQFEKLCEAKHKAIEDTLNRHEHDINEHGEKIVTLQKSDASNTTQINTLVKSMGGLTKAIWGLVASLVVTLFGFFIWYIQSL